MSYTPNILDVLTWPNPQLKLESKPVEVFDEELEHFIADMFATMKALDGVGLAAPQVNRQEQIITLRIEEDKPLIFINPEITETGNETYEWEEGCLSVPGYFKKRKRPSRVVVKFQSIDGEQHEFELFDIYAFAIQHEIDHLNGICFVDKVSRIWYPKIKKAIRKALPEVRDQITLARTQLSQYEQENNNNE